MSLWLFVTLWSIACQAPLSMGFSRQEYWSGLPFPPPGKNTKTLLTFIFSLFQVYSRVFQRLHDTCCHNSLKAEADLRTQPSPMKPCIKEFPTLLLHFFFLPSPPQPQYFGRVSWHRGYSPDQELNLCLHSESAKS